MMNSLNSYDNSNDPDVQVSGKKEERSLYAIGIQPKNTECLSLLQKAGYSIEVTEIAEHIHEHLAQRLPHILLLDIDGLGSQAFDLTKELKANPKTYILPIIIMIGDSESDSEIAAFNSGADEYLHKPISPQVLQARINTILKRHYRLQVSNPLTGLPGSIYIEEQINERLASNDILAVCYADLDNFKAFNDKYGYVRGNNVLLILANILYESISIFGGPKDFIGHIGGDDFLIVCEYEKTIQICDYVTDTFDLLIPYQYDEEDRLRGFIDARSRQHEFVRFPLMTVSMGVVTNNHRQLTSFLQISELTSEMKQYAKQMAMNSPESRSTYRIDQRNTPL